MNETTKYGRCVSPLRLRLGRRGFLGGAVAAGALGLAGLPGDVLAQAAARKGAVAPLPARGNFVIRNAYVMTMDSGLGDIAKGDVHVKDGAIVAVGRNVAAPGAERIDGTGSIVLPGFVETHWHMNPLASSKLTFAEPPNPFAVSCVCTRGS